MIGSQRYGREMGGLMRQTTAQTQPTVNLALSQHEMVSDPHDLPGGTGCENKDSRHSKPPSRLIGQLLCSHKPGSRDAGDGRIAECCYAVDYLIISDYPGRLSDVF
jgi:hypothetical protein